MSGSDKLEALWALIEGCRARGVTQFRYDGVGLLDGAVSFVLLPPGLGAEDPFDALNQTRRDPMKCSSCQVAAVDPRYAGMCRTCYLRQAGVMS